MSSTILPWTAIAVAPTEQWKPVPAGAGYEVLMRKEGEGLRLEAHSPPGPAHGPGQRLKEADDEF